MHLLQILGPFTRENTGCRLRPPGCPDGRLCGWPLPEVKCVACVMGQVSVSAPRSTVSTVHMLPVLESSGGSFTPVTRGWPFGGGPHSKDRRPAHSPDPEGVVRGGESEAQRIGDCKVDLVQDSNSKPGSGEVCRCVQAGDSFSGALPAGSASSLPRSPGPTPLQFVFVSCSS